MTALSHTTVNWHSATQNAMNGKFCTRHMASDTYIMARNQNQLPYDRSFKTGYFSDYSRNSLAQIDVMDFVTENNDGVKVITTAPLNEALRGLYADLEPLKRMANGAQEFMTSHYWSIIEHTWRVSLNTIMSYNSDIVSEEFWMSVAVLAESLETAMYDVFNDGHSNAWRSAGNPAVGKFLIEGMRRNGWCPFDVKRIDCTTGTVLLVYYLANLPPPRQHLDHEKCTDDLCVWMSIGMDYETKHMEPDVIV